MGLNAAFFDQLQGKILDKLYLRITDDGRQELYLTFLTEDIIRITSPTEMEIIWKEDANKKPVQLRLF